MLDWIALTCLIGAVILLITLAFVDLRTRLLPNEMVAGFAVLGFVFHLTTLAAYVPIPEIFLGGILGFSSLYLVRATANHIYEEDALGLGDVKLIGAAGIWLGLDTIMLTLAAGAMASLAHGYIYELVVAQREKRKMNLGQLQIPAGPGFVIGIIATGIYKFWGFSPL